MADNKQSVSFDMDEWLRRREYDLINRRELDDYHHAVQEVSGVLDHDTAEDMRLAHAREASSLKRGDQGPLEKYREVGFRPEIYARYDDERCAVSQMDRAQLSQRRQLRDAATHIRRGVSHDRW